MMLKQLDGALVEMSAAQESEARAMVEAGTALKRTISGQVDVLIPPDEEAAIRAEWAAADATALEAAAAIDLDAKRLAAACALTEEQLAARAKDADCPPAIKDYVEAVEAKETTP